MNTPQRRRSDGRRWREGGRETRGGGGGCFPPPPPPPPLPLLRRCVGGYGFARQRLSYRERASERAGGRAVERAAIRTPSLGSRLRCARGSPQTADADDGGRVLILKWAFNFRGRTNGSTNKMNKCCNSMPTLRLCAFLDPSEAARHFSARPPSFLTFFPSISAHAFRQQ